MFNRLIEANPCREDAVAFLAFVSKQSSVIHGSKDAKWFATKLNNFYLHAIGLPICEIEYMNKNFKPTFTLGQSMAVFEFLQLAAIKLSEDLDRVARPEAIDVLESVSTMLPGNNICVTCTMLTLIAISCPWLPTWTNITDPILMLCKASKSVYSLILWFFCILVLDL